MDHDQVWKEAYLREREALVRALGTLALEVHHIGSTAVPEMAAKPVIDIMVAVEDPSDLSTIAEKIGPLGYVHSFQEDEGRLFFSKGIPRTHHLHFVTWRGWPYYKHIWFRDYLIDHPGTAEEYEILKRVLASRHRLDRQAYTDGKHDLISMVLERATRERVSFLGGTV